MQQKEIDQLTRRLEELETLEKENKALRSEFNTYMQDTEERLAKLEATI